MMFRDVAETAAMAARGQQTPLDLRLRNRLSHTSCTRLLVQAIDALSIASDGQGIFLDKPLQQVWRDAHAAASHISLNWDAVSTMYGQYALGLEPKGSTDEKASACPYWTSKPDVLMVQTTEVRVGHDAAKSLNSTQRWCVLVQRLPRDLPE
jgi:hypothetical protein